MGWLEGLACVAKSSVVAFDIKLVFQAYWNTVQRSFCFLFFGIIRIELLGLLQSIIEEDFGQASIPSDFGSSKRLQ